MTSGKYAILMIMFGPNRSTQSFFRCCGQNVQAIRSRNDQGNHDWLRNSTGRMRCQSLSPSLRQGHGDG